MPWAECPLKFQGQMPRESSKRKRKMSRKQKRALGLDTASSASESGSDSSDSFPGAPPPLTRPGSTEPEQLAEESVAGSLRRSESAMSIQTDVSTVSQKNPDKKSDFDERYKTATRTNEEVLTAQMDNWTSDVYKHFRSPPAIHEKQDGTIQYIYTCKSRPSITVKRARHDESTSNLVRHVKLCTPGNSAQTNALAAFASGSKYNEAKHRMKCALWIARRSRPFAIIEDPELLDIFSDLNAACVTPKRKTIARDIREIWEMSRKELASFLQIMGFTADNASNNDTLVAELAGLVPGFSGASHRVRCFAHILNLVVKAILSPFSHQLKESTGVEDDGEGTTVIASDIDIEKELEALQNELISGEGVGDEEPDSNDDADEIAPDVLASDAAAIFGSHNLHL
ncbi:hypothetical protein CVT26_011413 [Gymnopilus dilepis]|uniref:HAT C-terminal dimerisation domain-containing protein n=1 Tax=Gymnopilus dilepis TaxID=231916 RepID=A0A409W8X2_9AGAR|nr:hypothetical protein CVT26_011413 [Gymnopilus dilepis]